MLTSAPGPALQCKDLQKAFDRRQFYVQKLERALWDFNNSPDKIRPQHKTGFMGWTGAKVDSIEFYTQKLEKYNTRCVWVAWLCL
jgi:hypothetical protein